MTRVLVRMFTLIVAVALVATSCGAADDAIETTDAATQEVEDVATGSGANEELPDEPIPVEPDGGIGDGAGPIPGTEDDSDQDQSGDWHGAQVAETNCPGTEFRRVEGSVFSFSVPVDFVDAEAQGVDSEIAILSTDTIEVSYDYGQYSSSLNLAGAERTSIDYSGIRGNHVVVRDNGGWNGRNLVGVIFADVLNNGLEDSRLNLVVLHDNPADEIIGRCIVGSLEWNLGG